LYYTHFYNELVQKAMLPRDVSIVNEQGRV